MMMISIWRKQWKKYDIYRNPYELSLPVWVTERPQLRIWSTSFCYEDKQFPNLQLLLIEIYLWCFLNKPVSPVLRWQDVCKYTIKQHQRHVCILIYFPLSCIVQVTKKPEKHIKNVVAFNRNAGFVETLSMSVRQHFLQSVWHFDSGLCGCSDCFERGEVYGHITP